MGTSFPVTYLPVGTRPMTIWLLSSNSNRMLTSSQASVNTVSKILSSQRSNIFLVMGSSSGMRDELAEWLVQPPLPTDDPLCWWLTNQNLYPCLSQMAIDIHIIPGTCSHNAFLSAVDVEHSFIRGRILISHLCNRLRASSIQAEECVNCTYFSCTLGRIGFFECTHYILSSAWLTTQHLLPTP
jgi:hypothetical protein